jgi:hypothetical protein
MPPMLVGAAVPGAPTRDLFGASHAPQNNLQALTLWLPWPWAMTRAVPLKTIENRTWPPPARLIGQRLALHAGKHWDAAGYDFIRGIDPRIPGRSSHPVGAVVAVVTVTGVATIHGGWTGPSGRRDSVFASPWFFGPVGWLCTDLAVLAEPVPCAGHQGLWRLPDDVNARVLAQTAVAT